MGDPKKQRKKFATPVHPWQKERIEEEKALIKEYGLKNKTEIWRMNSMLRNFKKQAKKLITLSTKQAETEKIQLLKNLKNLGLMKETSDLEDVLSLNIKDIMERRLQTIVHRKALAKSVNQARQFITHRHIIVKNKKITIPSYLISTDEESQISFTSKSSLASSEHPERKITPKKKTKKK